MNLIWDITFKCNLECIHCGAEKTNNLDEYSIDLKKLNNNSEIFDHITIVGGEPMLHPDIFKVVRLLKSNGKQVSIITNGQFSYYLYDELLTAGIDQILFSFEGNESENDKIRGIGSYKRAMGNIRRLYSQIVEQKYSTTVGINVTINKLNSKTLSKTIDAWNHYFLNSRSFIIQCNRLILEGKVRDHKDILYLNDIEYLDVLEELAPLLAKYENLRIDFDKPFVRDYLFFKYGIRTDREENYECSVLYESMYMLPDLSITACRKTTHVQIGEFRIGNLTQFNYLYELLNKQSYRDGCEKCSYSSECKSCPLSIEDKQPLICQSTAKKLDSLFTDESKFHIGSDYLVCKIGEHYRTYYPELGEIVEYSEDAFKVLVYLNNWIDYSNLSDNVDIDSNVLRNHLMSEVISGRVDCMIKEM